MICCFVQQYKIKSQTFACLKREFVWYFYIFAVFLGFAEIKNFIWREFNTSSFDLICVLFLCFTVIFIHIYFLLLCASMLVKETTEKKTRRKTETSDFNPFFASRQLKGIDWNLFFSFIVYFPKKKYKKAKRLFDIHWQQFKIKHLKTYEEEWKQATT